MRTSSNFLTAVNFVKMSIGLAFISQSKGVQQAGFYGSAIGATYVLAINIFSVYLIVKARNRFKRDANIVDICDLGARLYGEGTRGWFIAALFTCNLLFLMCYAVFFGSQTDQLVCQTWKQRDCGHSWEYSALIVLCLLPILYQRELSNIGYFSAAILVFSVIAIAFIIYLTIDIYSLSVEQAKDKYAGLELQDDDRDYVYLDWVMIPIFIANFMNVFEGS